MRAVDIRRRATALAAIALLGIGAVACGGGDTGDPSPTATTGPAELTQADAASAVGALCRMASDGDVSSAKATFYDDAHATLHAIARAADAQEVGSDAELLITMQRVEAELEQASLPPAYADDVRALRLATQRTLEGIDVDVPGC